MFPFDKNGGVLHLAPSVAERVSFLALDTGPSGELVLPVTARNNQLMAARRVTLLPGGWVRALVGRETAGEQIMADVLFAPGEVLAVHNEWAEKEGPGSSDNGSREPADQRIREWEESWAESR